MRIEKHIVPPHAECRCDESAQRKHSVASPPGTKWANRVCYACFLADANAGAQGIRVGTQDRSGVTLLAQLTEDLVDGAYSELGD